MKDGFKEIKNALLELLNDRRPKDVISEERQTH